MLHATLKATDFKQSLNKRFVHLAANAQAFQFSAHSISTDP